MGALPPVFMEFIGLTAGFKTATKEVISGLDEVGRKGTGLGAKVQKGGLISLAAVSTAVTAIGVESVKQAANFQSELNLLVVSGGEHVQNIKAISSGIQKIAVDTGTTTQDLASSMYVAEKAGFNYAHGGLEVVRVSAEAAKAENVDLGTATNALTSVMMSYGYKAKDAVMVQNEMIAGAGMAKTNMQEYASALSTVLPVASSAHINFAQLSGAIATLTQHGTSAQESTQELANTIRNLQKPLGPAQDAMQQMGINVVDLTSHLGQRGLTGTISIITDAIARHFGPAGLVIVNAMKQSATATADAQQMLEHMPAAVKKVSEAYFSGKIGLGEWRKEVKALPGDQAGMANQFKTIADSVHGFNSTLRSGGAAAKTAAAALGAVMGGATGMNTALMLSGTSTAYFHAAVKRVGDASKNAGKDVNGWKDTQKTFNVQMDRFKEVLQTTEIQIGTKLLPTATKFATWLTAHKTLVIDVVAALGGLMLIYGTVSAAMAVYTKTMRVFEGVSKTVKMAQQAYAMWTYRSNLATTEGTAATESNIVVTTLQAVKTAVVTAATKAWEGAQWLLNAALDANPMGLIILLIAGMVAGIILAYKHSKTFRDIVHDAFHVVAEAANYLWKAVKESIGGIVKFVGDVIGFFRRYGPIIAEVILAPFTGGMSLILPWILNHWGAISNWFANLPSLIWNALSGLASWMGSIGSNIVTGIWNGIAGMGSWLWNQLESWASSMIPGPIKKVLGIFSPSRVMADDIGHWIPAGIAQGITNNSGAVKGAMGNIAATIGQFNPSTSFGGLGGLSGGGAVVSNVYVTVQGTVTAEQDLANAIQQQQLRTGMRRGAARTYQPFAKR